MANNRSNALKLINERGHGLVKMLSFDDFSITDKPERKTYNALNPAWSSFFQKMLEPQAQNNLARDQSILSTSPEEEKGEADNLNFRDDPSRVTTHATLMASGGRMNLLDRNVQHGVGLVFNLAECDLRDEGFGEERNASPHWMANSPFGTRFNDLEVGVRSKALTSIFLQPDESAVGSNEYYNQRFDAIYRKLYVAGLTNRHLPILISNPNAANADAAIIDYSFEQQQSDLAAFLQDNPTNAFAKSLLERNEALVKTFLPEIDAPSQTSVVPPADIERNNEIQALLLDKIALRSQEASILRARAALNKREKTDLKSSLDDFDKVRGANEEAYDDLNNHLQALEAKLAYYEVDPRDFIPLYKLLQIQESQVAALQGAQRSEKKLHFTITEQEMQASLPTTHFNWIKTAGLVYSRDVKPGMDQLYADYLRKLEVLGEKSQTSAFQTRENFEAFLKQKLTPQQIELLKNHYSQGPLLFGYAAFSNPILADLGLQINHPQMEDISNELFMEDGQIKIKCRFERYPVIRIEDRELIDFLEGPVEWTFKLTDQGFAFDNLKTASDLILMTFLGRELTLESLESHLHLNPQSPEILTQYKLAAEEYLLHLESSSIAKARTKIHVMHDLQALLYKGEFGLVKSAESPERKSQTDIARMISPYEQAYILVKDKLYLAVADKAGATLVKAKTNLDEKSSGLEFLIQQLNKVAMPAEHTSRRLSALELSKIQEQTGKYHAAVSPQHTNKMFRHNVKEHEAVLGKKRESDVVTGLKSLGTFGASILPKALFKSETKQKIAEVKVPHGMRFIRALNTISEQELPVEALRRRAD
jgi:hypothetical protein